MKLSIADRFFFWSSWGVVVTALTLCAASVLASDWVNTALFGGCSVVAVYLAWCEKRWLRQGYGRVRLVGGPLSVPASETVRSPADR